MGSTPRNIGLALSAGDPINGEDAIEADEGLPMPWLGGGARIPAAWRSDVRLFLACCIFL